MSSVWRYYQSRCMERKHHHLSGLCSLHRSGRDPAIPTPPPPSLSQIVVEILSNAINPRPHPPNCMNASHIPLRGIAGQSSFYLVQVTANSEADQLLTAYLSNPSNRDGVKRWHHCLAHAPYEALGILSYAAICSSQLRTWLLLQLQLHPKQKGDRPDSDRPLNP